MKFLHLSDLHLGKRVNEISMLDDQRYILDRILEQIDLQKPEAVLISGDVYDKTLPPAEAVSLFDGFLWALSRRKLQVLIISGNHDSPERLSFGGRLMEGSGIHISPVYDGHVEPVVLTDSLGPVYFYLMPFVKPAHVRRFFEDEPIESYTDALAAAVSRMQPDPAARNVLLTHQFVTGAETCESEELSVGGTDNVDAEVFRDFDYVALGHLHGPQNIVPGKIRYCGTPLKYSFSEERHHKSLTFVTMEEKGDLTVETVPLTPLHDLRTIRGTYRELTEKSFYSGTAADDYLQVVLTDEEDVPEALGRLRVIYPNIMHLRYDNTRTRMDQAVDSAGDVQCKSPLELFDELYTLQNNKPLSPVQRSYLEQLMETIQEELL